MGWALRTLNASADHYSISWAILCLQGGCLSSTSSNITALLSAFKASEELASHRRTNLVFCFISHQFTEQVGGPHPCQFHTRSRSLAVPSRTQGSRERGSAAHSDAARTRCIPILSSCYLPVDNDVTEERGKGEH